MAKRHKEFLLKVTGIQCPHWCTVAFWTIGITIMAAMTVKDLRPILRDYMDDDENTQIQINVKRGDDSAIKRPDLYFCMTLVTRPDYRRNFTEFTNAILDHITSGKPCPLCEAMANHSWDVWNQYGNLSFFKGLNTSDEEGQKLLEETLSVLIIHKFLDTEFNKSMLGTENFEWSRPVLSVLFMELYSAYSKERKYFDGDEVLFDITKYTNFYDGRLDRLYSTMVEIMCQLIYFYQLPDERQIDGPECARIIYASSSLYFPEDVSDMRFCFKLPIQSDQFTLNVVESYYMYLNSKREFKIYNENPAHVKIGETLEPVLISTSRDMEQFDFETFKVVYSLHTNVVEDRPNKLKTCYWDSSRSECAWKCRTDRMESGCGCELFTKSKLRSDMSTSNHSRKYCVERDLETCVSEIMSQTTSTDRKSVFECKGECLDACESSSYQFQSNAELVSHGDDTSTFFIQVFRRQQEPYLEFTRKVRDSSEELVSKVGGVVNFYLGLSWLSIILFMIYLFDTWRRYRELSNDDGEGHRSDRPAQAQDETSAGDSGPSPASAAWGWSWLQMMTMAKRENEAKSDGPEVSILERRINETDERVAKVEKRMEDVVEQIGELKSVMRNIERMLAAKSDRP